VGYLAFCLVYLLAAQSRAQETEEAVPADQAFVNRFWQADSEAARMALSEQLLVSQPDPAALFELLKVGPLYSDMIRSGNGPLSLSYMAVSVGQRRQPERISGNEAWTG
jgi:hypothetical protein